MILSIKPLNPPGWRKVGFEFDVQIKNAEKVLDIKKIVFTGEVCWLSIPTGLRDWENYIKRFDRLPQK